MADHKVDPLSIRPVFPTRHFDNAAARRSCGDALVRDFTRSATFWTIPGVRIKTQPHDVHLSEPARELRGTLPRIHGCDLVLTTTGRTPISGFSKAKRDLDAAITRIKTDPKAVRSAPAPWRLHDLRRTGVSKLAALGFDSIVADKLLVYKPAKLRGVAAGISGTISRKNVRAPSTHGRHMLSGWKQALTLLSCGRQSHERRKAATQRG